MQKRTGNMSEIDLALATRFRHILEQENWDLPTPPKRGLRGGAGRKVDPFLVAAVVGLFAVVVAGLWWWRRCAAEKRD